MNQLRLLWELQNHDLSVSKIKSNIDSLNTKNETEELSVKLNEKKYDLANKQTQLDLDKMKIQRFEQKLKQLTFDLKEAEEKLYGGDISNFKQLEQLEKESSHIKKEIKEVENDILQLMEKTESLEIEIKGIEEDYEKVSKKIVYTKQECKNRIACLKEELKNEKAIMDELTSQIDRGLLHKYNSLKMKKKKVIAEVDIDKCTGCHMAIPTSLLSKIQNLETITYCDNCGRILFYNQETK